MSDPQAKSILIYTTPWCPYCHAAKQLLDEKGVTYEEIDVSSDPELRRDVARRSGRTTVPQVFIDEAPHGGYDDLAALDRAGRLEPVVRFGPTVGRGIPHRRIRRTGSSGSGGVGHGCRAGSEASGPVPLLGSPGRTASRGMGHFGGTFPRRSTELPLSDVCSRSRDGPSRGRGRVQHLVVRYDLEILPEMTG